jgi:hypothetical protein
VDCGKVLIQNSNYSQIPAKKLPNIPKKRKIIEKKKGSEDNNLKKTSKCKKIITDMEPSPEIPASLQKFLNTPTDGYFENDQEKKRSGKNPKKIIPALSAEVLKTCKKAIHTINFINSRIIANGTWQDNENYYQFQEFENHIEIVQYKCYQGNFIIIFSFKKTNF